MRPFSSYKPRPDLEGRGETKTEDRYATGDGRTFRTERAALNHAGNVYDKTGVIVSVEKTAND